MLSDHLASKCETPLPLKVHYLGQCQ